MIMPPLPPDFFPGLPDVREDEEGVERFCAMHLCYLFVTASKAKKAADTDFPLFCAVNSVRSGSFKLAKGAV